jgi:hypothetical protein
MRQMISGLVAAVAVMAASAVPAMACGGLFQSGCSPCGEQAYVSPCARAYVPAPVYSDCDSCGSVRERLPDPVQQYYYVDQGPTYTGPGNFAPRPVYREGSVSRWDSYRRPHYYGYSAHPHYRPWLARPHYRFSERPSLRYGYAPRHSYAPQYVQRPHYAPRRDYAPRPYYAPHRMTGYGMPHHNGYRERVLRRYY